MKLVLFEDLGFTRLLPLVYFRPVWELRCGAMPLGQRIARYMEQPPFALAREYLRRHYLSSSQIVQALADSEELLMINGRWLMGKEEAAKVLELNENGALVCQGEVVAFRIRKGELSRFEVGGVIDASRVFQERTLEEFSTRMVRYLWEAVDWNGEALAEDYQHFADQGRREGNIFPGVHMVREELVTVEAGAVIKPGVVIDAENGPVWIGQGTKIMPNAVLEGPLYVGEHSTIKVGAKIYENTTIGPVCKIGGEVEASIIQGYSNKQHDGFLGHAFLGEWVNLGADTNNSDLKNNYGLITVLVNGEPVPTERRFVGLMMGDHSKCAINTMFNTGTVVGVCCNIFGAGMPPKFVPSFSWGGAEGLTGYDFDKALEVARVVMARRQVAFTENTRHLFEAVRRLAREVEKGSLI